MHIHRVSLRHITRYAAYARSSRHLSALLTTSVITHRASLHTEALHKEALSEQPGATAATIVPAPLRKRLKDEAKRQKQAKSNSKASTQTVDGWELTVGVEIHAQLNSPTKLFSAASVAPQPASHNCVNQHAAPFDLAVPGSQPLFQPPVLIPAIRAALALGCTINTISRFDRKHYFWWDQPAGYQITQYYEPFAQAGQIKLQARDGIAVEDGESTTVRIKQVQLEQDTAKTLSQPGDTHWIDFNRSGAPLIEIITEPDMHHPRTAAVFVQKVQALLKAFDVCVVGMESGGLRADVNVSVRRTDDLANTPLGVRTEIKNLSTIKAIEDAIIAERNRQIRELEAGGTISSETRGWTLGSRETRRLRGKEGEVDYRYMPDADLPPLIIAPNLIQELRQSIEATPDTEIDMLMSKFGLKLKDALALTASASEDRLEYFYNVVDALHVLQAKSSPIAMGDNFIDHKLSLLASNWVLHEFGRLAKAEKGLDATAEAASATPDKMADLVSVDHLAELLHHLHNGRITLGVAKEVFFIIFLDGLEVENTSGNSPHRVGISEYLEKHNLWFTEIDALQYRELAEQAISNNAPRSYELLKTNEPPKGRVMWLLGDMLRNGPLENMVPANAEKALREVLAELRGAHLREER
ncbi:Glutamyl-tRNA(Gln) amidotransferase subunit B, mitochondrial [Ceratocystis fimbriata CBS 114723]|uniref:Glutamyl-tRNA(Gln) amidotransferase subunit B, mitochondrial n=1 Tax=Ceratocystis fimbriata CBS 114723 TaxID=1035309 RepID=A0A2C5XDD2_9PEZI|nr:Glutamyl-tRNA(Gln) amidotransferase subunit B, mitochondrial [Ceratocystis fimbriata CBS 114723]